MEARESEPLPARRDAALREVLLMHFAPSLIVVVGIAAYGWHARAPHVLLPWVVMVGGIASSGYTVWKRHRTGQLPAIKPDPTPWFTLLTIGMGYLLYRLFDLSNPWVVIARIAIRIRRVAFGD